MLSRPLAWALLAAPVLAQQNAVPGLDINVYDVTDITYYGHRGAAYPAGEAGFMVGHSHCNRGTVNLPWVSTNGAGQMVDSYPRLAFLLARESGGRMVQISGQGHSKHSPTAFNFASGPCAPCQAGGGGFFFVGCSDTYGSGINSSQFWLGPNDEINPWLGTWNPVGSYFDRGDPAVTGAAATDGVRSLNSTAGWDPVKNRIVVRESELVAGASYVAQVHGVYQGEPVGNRGDNTVSCRATISASASGVTASLNGVSSPGSVLTKWTGANWAIGGNGQDDGRFLVAVKATGPVAGMYHYEYAVHNLDNSRGGAGLHIPIAPGATVQNFGFRDLDTDPLNDWLPSVVGNEIVFAAQAANALEWNTIYNCWFDCSVPPGAGTFGVDQARPGPGALTVAVAADVPSGLSYATKSSVGASCGQCTGTFYEVFTNAASFDLAGRALTLSLANGAYAVSPSAVAFVPAAGVNLGLGFNVQTFANLPFALPYPGGSTTSLQVSASGYVSPGTPNTLQLIGSAAQLLQGQPRWCPLWLPWSPVVASANNVWFDATPQRAILTWNAVSPLAGGAACTFQIQFFPSGTVHMVWQTAVGGSFGSLVGWSTGGSHTDPGPRDLSTLAAPLALCSAPFDGMGLSASANPVLGTTVQWQVSNLPVGAGWGAMMRSLTQAVPPIDLTAYGMPGCFAHVVNPVATAFAAGSGTQLVAEPIPTNTALVGVALVGQAVAFQPTLNSLGLVASNGMVLVLGL